ncbi:MAG: choice-of-anchor R domain-containing protein [bacterium]
MKSKFFSLVVAASLLITSALKTQAADFDVSNLTETIQGAETISGSNVTKQIAQKFNTGSFATPTSVWLVQLYLSSFGNYNLANLSVQIFTDASATPGTSVGSFSATGSLTTGGIYNFTNIASPVALAANTNYWVVIKNSVVGSGANNINWAYGDSSTPTPGINGVMSTISSVNNTGSSWTTFTTTPQLVRLTNVPEPSTYALGTICALSMGYIARRRKTVAA